MVIDEIFEIAFVSLWRNKLRSLLTMLGIIIGVTSVILLISIGSGLQSYVAQQFESLGSNLIYVTPGQVGGGGPPVASTTFNDKDVRAIKRIGYPIKFVGYTIATYAKAKYKTEEKNAGINGTDGQTLKELNYEAEYGRLMENRDIDKTARIAVIGPKIAQDLFKLKNPVGKSFFIQSTQYKVVGVFKSKGGSGGVGPSLDEDVYIPVTTAQKQFNQDGYNSIYVKVYSKDEITNAKKKIEEIMLKSYDKDSFSVLGQEDLLKTINQILGVISAALGGIAAISLLVGGIGIMNIMFVTVTERTKEIGLRKALGARPKDILVQFLIESVTVSLIGGTIGISLALLSSAILNQFLSSQVQIGAILLAFGFSSLIGIIFGVVPAWKAAKLDPIKALRYE